MTLSGAWTGSYRDLPSPPEPESVEGDDDPAEHVGEGEADDDQVVSLDRESVKLLSTVSL